MLNILYIMSKLFKKVNKFLKFCGRYKISLYQKNMKITKINTLCFVEVTFIFICNFKKIIFSLLEK